MASISTRVRDARSCVGYLGNTALSDSVKWTTGSRDKTFSLSLKEGDPKPVSLVMIGRVDNSRLYVSGLGNWTPKFDRPCSGAKWSLRIIEPVEPELKLQYKMALDTLIDLQKRGSALHSKSATSYIGSDQDSGSIKLAAPMVETRTTEPSVWNSYMDMNVIEQRWTVTDGNQPRWKALMESHRMKPLRVWDEDEDIVEPPFYAKYLPGALVEVHFSLFLYAWADPGIFSAQIEQLIIWRRGSPNAGNSAYENVPLLKGPYRETSDCMKGTSKQHTSRELLAKDKGKSVKKVVHPDQPQKSARKRPQTPEQEAESYHDDEEETVEQDDDEKMNDEEYEDYVEAEEDGIPWPDSPVDPRDLEEEEAEEEEEEEEEEDEPAAMVSPPVTPSPIRKTRPTNAKKDSPSTSIQRNPRKRRAPAQEGEDDHVDTVPAPTTPTRKARQSTTKAIKKDGPSPAKKPKVERTTDGPPASRALRPRKAVQRG